MDESYLADPAFSEPHRGPCHVDGNGCAHGRDPSRRQIARMRLAIRRAYPRAPVGQDDGPVEVPVVSEDTFHLRSVDRF